MVLPGQCRIWAWGRAGAGDLADAPSFPGLDPGMRFPKAGPGVREWSRGSEEGPDPGHPVSMAKDDL